MARTGVAEFIKQVRQETMKVTWSSRKETITSTIVVLIMVFIASLFFLLVDSVILKLTQLIMGF
ncbi:MAG: preprotein translocase subunit SecE [Rickettsiales bacterium]|nr:preprotein translocase subunit SecE [Pseudomonadota bacterium]MDA0967139.1 preprotein translocase subunit SecE [Pseudomonadota bacterium]MDG4544324.1 preprotein translocase subunit SecE [Rickettsiales bacterium]MDG4546454.1 preprotein translocase subunit SecE [Rickettsiales bacterium]MDG4548600.1 preprotein translocase subunit SecE [Rickettsiales bacterium]